MLDIVLTIWFFIVLIPSIYLLYTSLQCFDYEKILKKGKVRELKIVLFIVSVGFAFLFANCFVSIIERIAKIFQ
ncbi:MAG: DUF1146 family protein [Bacilli bacterium]|mgnify:CR=1 FL=1|nr:DUF1146 domain-containing protein [Acholeplasmataceae bacterium]MDY2901944.1 DUF1146 family protein [Bacilli bacterium]